MYVFLSGQPVSWLRLHACRVSRRPRAGVEEVGGRGQGVCFLSLALTSVVGLLVACLPRRFGAVSLGVGGASGSVRLRERHVRLAGVFATEHAEDVLPAPPQPPRVTRPQF